MRQVSLHQISYPDLIPYFLVLNNRTFLAMSHLDWKVCLNIDSIPLFRSLNFNPSDR